MADQWRWFRELTERFFGINALEYVESEHAIAGATAQKFELHDPAICNLIDEVREALPKGCKLSVHQIHPQLVFVLAENEEHKTALETQIGLRRAA